MKLLPNYLCQKIQRQLLCTSSTHTHLPNGSLPESLYGKILPLSDPNSSVGPVLDQWVINGEPAAYKEELRKAIYELTTLGKYQHALQVSKWMTNIQSFPIKSSDIALQLKLIFKTHGLDQLDKYNDLPENLKTCRVYTALLNCNTVAKDVDRAESTMQKVRDLGYANKPILYNLMMNLHYQLGNDEKVANLMTEMERKGISHDQFTYSVCLSACSMASDVSGMDEILKNMESNPVHEVQWRSYVIAAEGYLRMGLTDKALSMLSKLEIILKASEGTKTLYLILFKLYAEAGQKDGLFRVWNLYKENGSVISKGYISMMCSLLKLDDIEGAEKLFAEWETSGFPFDFRVPNVLIDAYVTSDRLEKAEDLVTNEISRGGDPNVMTWCHLAGGYLKRNQVSKCCEPD